MDHSTDNSPVVSKEGSRKNSRGSSSFRQPNRKFARAYGIVMVVAAFIWLYFSLGIWDTEINRLKNMANFKDSYYYFVNPEELTGGLAVIGTLQGFAGILITLGTYRIIYARKSTWLVFVAFPVFFALSICQALYINSVREDVHTQVLANQHEWAEGRYGITYDEITIKEVNNSPTGNERRSYDVQDAVMKDGEVIASVCEAENRQSTYFCEPGTTTEIITQYYGPQPGDSQDGENPDDAYSSYDDYSIEDEPVLD